ncbi:hypothetical protein KGQ27_00275 [Patescibacteria group bacterium]|nr:hypothetical protein [Patescibacteria group bacterium]MDE1946652.1 hypothetical protein [Patescibacteria group bacterium]MDE2010605.1 hypothetical protein [Patescibacteria group bacterium]MDE2232948.1 hypothetical protein [Patescibacteria group bacterium]
MFKSDGQNSLLASLCLIAAIMPMLATVLIFNPVPAHAQLGSLFGCKSLNVSFSQRVPVQDNSTDAMKSAKCTWDGVAWTVAKIALQEVTTSVVNWINSGFQGNPAFLTNPQAFFLDVADQVTGDFIAQTGILANLCTPFNVDIRLALALGQANLYPRYTCTLSTVIQSVANSTVNGYSIQGFMNGDFKQGGWPAFITMTTQPQNNPVGAYLVAQSDLLSRISSKQGQYHEQLAQGGGFLSWQKCQTVDTIDPNDLSPDNYNTAMSYENAGLTRQQNKDGTVSYQDCETQTPGSVIAGSINKSLGIPQDQLNLANSINEVVGALFGQLVTKVLTGGLHTASSPGGSSGLPGAIYQLQQQSQNEQLASAKQSILSAANDYYSLASQYDQTYKQITDSITATKNQYSAAKTCFDGKVGSTTQTAFVNQAALNYARGQMAAIDSAIATKVEPLETIYGVKMAAADQKVVAAKQLISDINSASTVDDINAISTRFNGSGASGSDNSTYVSSLYISQDDVQGSQTDLKTVQDALKPFADEAAKFQQSCDSFPDSAGSSFLFNR